MIYGIGVDIVEIDRVRKIVIRSGDKFAKRILRESELKIYYYKKKRSIHFLSKRFAAKEAALKAFGTGLQRGLTFNQLEIFNDTLGRPVLRFFANAAVLVEKLSLIKTHITVSDTKINACAVVIFEK